MTGKIQKYSPTDQSLYISHPVAEVYCMNNKS